MWVSTLFTTSLPPLPTDRYQEIDWLAYMQEVEGWLGGELDYTKLRGSTGPLVYPAGFVYLYAALRWLVGGGGRGAVAIGLAQWIFFGLYLCVLAIVLRVYALASSASARGGAGAFPPWVVLLLPLSKRLHSLFFLRLFNDCWSAGLLWAALALLARGSWAVGVLAWSLAVSIKMNGLLWLPALGLLLLRNVGVARTAALLAAAVALQAALGAPFLLAAPRAYMSKAFELDRVFFHEWTVNWAFLPRDVFVSRAWATALLAAHGATLVVLADRVWCAADGGLVATLTRVASHEIARLRGAARAPAAAGAFADAPSAVVHALLAANFVGVAFARTLHYQFYAWYAQSLPLLLWSCRVPAPLALAAVATIEVAFNVGDAKGAGTPLSSAALTAAHAVVLVGLFFYAPAAAKRAEPKQIEKALPGGSAARAATPTGRAQLSAATLPRSSSRATPARLRGRAESKARRETGN
jgi:alpha-1,3-mannosyltransferase